MKILLVGEYSRLHNSLKEGLVALGHEVKIVGTGDHFKGFPVDFSIAAKVCSDCVLGRFLNKVSVRLFGLDLEQLEKGWRFRKLLPKLKNYDVVQLINSDAVETFPSWQMQFYQKLADQNHKLFLLICGEETPIIDELLKGKQKYSILTPYLENPDLEKSYGYTLKYISKPYRKLYDFAVSKSSGIIVSDLDYKIPMDQRGVATTYIPNPINTDQITFINNPIDDKIVIFHGKNTLSANKKGSLYFEKALEMINRKYPDKVSIISASNMPYAQYIAAYDKAHILLDQVYSFDQGYNALEAMAKGKVVFTGAEAEFVAYFHLNQPVNINALPDVTALVTALSQLIENPKTITTIGKNARNFIEKEHHYIKIAQRYVDQWAKIS